MPSVPAKTSHWKSAEERAADREEHGRHRRQAAVPERQLLRFLRVPESLADASPPPPVLAATAARAVRALEVWLPSTGPVAEAKRAPADGLLPVTPEKRQRWSLDGPAAAGAGSHSKGQPLSQEAADRKVGAHNTCCTIGGTWW